MGAVAFTPNSADFEMPFGFELQSNNVKCFLDFK
jgi:hypothetical protein